VFQINYARIQNARQNFHAGGGVMRGLSTLFLLILLPPLMLLLTGCPGTVSAPPTPQPTVVTLIDDSDRHLNEQHYLWYGDPITIDKSGRIDVYFNLKEWDEDYRLEIIFLTVDNFLHFKNDETFSAVDHRSILYTGVYEFNFNVSPGSYYLVVDNSDLGWENTDWDGYNDDAVFDLHVTYTTSTSY